MRAALMVIVLVFILYVAAKAIAAGLDSSDFPEALAVKLEALPRLFPLHMFSGGLALLAVPLAYALHGRRIAHRRAGRIAVALVLVSGITAFPVAVVAPVTRVSMVGFCLQASLWLGLAGAGVLAIRQRRVARHRACMLLMMAVTSGAVLFRLALASWAIFGTWRSYTLFYACDAWVAWLAPLVLCGAGLASQRRR